MALSIRSDIVTLDSSLVPLFVSEKVLDQYFQVATTAILVYHTSEFKTYGTELLRITNEVQVTTLDKEVGMLYSRASYQSIW